MKNPVKIERGKRYKFNCVISHKSPVYMIIDTQGCFLGHRLPLFGIFEATVVNILSEYDIHLGSHYKIVVDNIKWLN
jgi:hypothetical protein